MICRTDREFQYLVKDGAVCVLCRERPGNQAHHLITRGVARYKRETLNGVAVCEECHPYPARILRAVEKWEPEKFAWYQEHKHEVKTGVQQRLAHSQVSSKGRRRKKVLSGVQKRLAGGGKSPKRVLSGAQRRLEVVA